jgi:hypothetical protein
MFGFFCRRKLSQGDTRLPFSTLYIEPLLLSLDLHQVLAPSIPSCSKPQFPLAIFNRDHICWVFAMTIRSGHITRFELIDGREEAAKQLS